MYKNVLMRISAADLAVYARLIVPCYTEGMAAKKAELETLVAELERLVGADRCNKNLREIRETILPRVLGTVQTLKVLTGILGDDASWRINHQIRMARKKGRSINRVAELVRVLTSMEAPEDQFCVRLLTELRKMNGELSKALGDMLSEHCDIMGLGNNTKVRRAIVDNIWYAYTQASLFGDGDNDVSRLLDMVDTVCDKARQTLANSGERDDVEEEEDGDTSSDGNQSGEGGQNDGEGAISGGRPNGGSTGAE